MVEQLIFKNDFLRIDIPERFNSKHRFNIAIHQNEIDIIHHLPGTITWRDVNIYQFSEMDELFRLARRCILDLIIFATSVRLDSEIALIAKAKERPSLATVPAIIYHPEPHRDTYLQALECGADDLIEGTWNSEIFGIRIQMLTERSKRDLGVNPTSKLPGPILINKEIQKHIDKGEQFAVCYLDIDNFKSYNDYYGYMYGDKVIRLTAHIIRDIVLDLVHDGFVGHVAGDDFIFIIPYEKVDIVNSNIIKAFDNIIPYKYKDEDREKGSIVSKDRRGVEQVFPLLTISIAILVNYDKMFTHVGEMSHMLADLKKYTKTLAGSNYMIERRHKY